MKKQIKNLIIITFILILIFPIQGIKVFAMGIGDSTYLEKGNLGFYTIQYCSKTSKNWYYITYSRTWYKDENGVRRIAYCVDPDLSGIGWIDGEVSGYNINISKVLEDQRLWRVYRNGYPYVTPKDLGVETEDDAYLATKQAAYWIIRGYKLEDINTYFRPGDTPINGQKLEDIQRRGKKVIDAIYRLVDLGYNGTQTSKYNNIVKINKIGEFKLDENKEYYSQKYNVISSTEMSGYDVKNTFGFPEGSYIANLEGNKQKSFKKGEDFKIMIPKKAIINNIDGKIEVQSKCQNYPVYYGEAEDKKKQNYAIMVDSYSDIVESTNLHINAYKSKIKLIKVDKDTKEKLSRVKFELKYDDGTKIGEYITDENGEINIENLRQGTIIATELESRDEYVINKESTYVKLEYKDSVKIELENEHKKGNLTIYKVDKDNNKIAIEGTLFSLYSKELNKVIGRYKTDKDGKITINNIRTGEYSLIEEKTNKWYNLAKDKNLEVKWNDTTVVTVENELKKSRIKVIKEDKEDNKIKLKNVKFQVLDKNNNILETIITDENGEAVTSKYALKDYNELYLKEIKTNGKYVLDDKIYKVSLKENQTVNVVIQNKKIKGQIKIIKTTKNNNKITNQNAGDPIEGVKFGIYDENKNLIEIVTTDKKGEAITGMLDKGKKYVKELEAAKFYVLDEKEYSIEIKSDGQISSLNLENIPENPEVSIEKTGSSKVKQGQEILYNFNVKNVGNVMLDNFTWIDYLPKENVKISKLATGTYTQDLNYNVYYKTNKSDYKLLKENLNTQINNYIDFSQIILKENERITEIKVDFGKVNVDFKSKISPHMIVKTDSDIKDKSIVANTAEVFAEYKGYKLHNKDEHKTEIYMQELNLKKLPRTGK